MGPGTYVVHYPDTGKSKERLHAKRMERTVWEKMMVRKVKDVEEEDCSEVTERQVSVVSLTHLEDIKQQELQHLLDQFPDFFRQEVM